MALNDKVGSKAYWDTITDRKNYLLCADARDKENVEKYNPNYNAIFRKGKKRTWKDEI